MSLESNFCVICHLDNHGQRNFGVASCRACSAFFRRSVVDKKTYTCIYNGQCDVTKSCRNNCRACRLKKCYDFGMCEDDIKFNKLNDLPSIIMSNKKLKTIKPKIDVILTQPKNLDVAFQYPTIYRLFNGSKALQNSIKAMVACNDPSVSFTGYNLKLMSKHLFDKLETDAFSLISNMLNDYYEPFSVLKNDQKSDLLKSIAMPISVLLKLYQTSVIFSSIYDKRTIPMMGYYGDTSAETYFSDELDMPEGRRIIFKKISDGFRKIVNHYISFGMNDVELALLVYMIFKSQATNFLLMETSVQKMSTQFFEEVYNYYTKKYGPERAGVKFGHLFTIFHEFMEYQEECNRDLTLYSLLFGYYDAYVDLEKLSIL